jgi:hypothetical protein
LYCRDLFDRQRPVASFRCWVDIAVVVVIAAAAVTLIVVALAVVVVASFAVAGM